MVTSGTIPKAEGIGPPPTEGCVGNQANQQDCGEIQAEL